MSQKRTVRQALQFVADYPVPVDDEQINMHTGELVARTLFEIANTPDANVRGSMARANRARKLIFDRLGGRRRAGTAPYVPSYTSIRVRDLTGLEVEDGQS
jgi:hypothetical protein